MAAGVAHPVSTIKRCLGWEVLPILRMAHKYYRRCGKKILDKSGALVALVLLWPLLLLVIVALRMTAGKPALFRQVRPGLHGRPFEIFKFRTMNENRDEKGDLLPDEERVTLIGRILRSLSLDELPELLNVLKGEMSLVGPRPLMMRYLERYTADQARRNDVLPGITGWAQIHGRNNISWEARFAYDVWYVDHVSLFLDIFILLVTIWKVITREGISEEGHYTSSEFMGNQKVMPKHDTR